MLLTKMVNSLVNPIKNHKGQGMVEYALLVGLIAVVVIAVLLLLGPAIAAKFQDIVNAL